MTPQEQENIKAALAITGSEESPISVSDAYTAMEFYLSADSDEDFLELSSASLAHLYFVKVQYKPIEYDRMNADDKQTWNKSQMKKIRKLTKKSMIEALVEAVRVHFHLIWELQLTLSNRGEKKASPTTLTRSVTQTRSAFLVQRMQIPTVVRPGVLGRSRLQKIWCDMKRTTLPSCLSPAPPRIGDKGQGKISADGWRVFSTVHLIVTLGRVWGSLPEDTREYQLFSNLCDLVGAIKIATGRSITVALVLGHRAA